MANGRILIIDDDKEMRDLLQDFLTAEGFEVLVFPMATMALHAIRSNQFEGAKWDREQIDVIISDIKMPEMTGLEFVDAVKPLLPNTPIILTTAFGSIESAIDAIRLGAFDYIVKPFKLAEIRVTIDRAARFYKLERDNQVLRAEVKKTWTMGNLIGKSSAMQSVFDLVNRVAQAQANVLITGESGSGKEMVARAIHNLGPRSKGPFVAINCTAIPETLLESELFGHAKGSFTGAFQKKKGLFEEAEGGTLFLDEIGDLDPGLQAKLLRVLQEKKIKAVGDNTYKDIDVRIIAATHKDLKAAIKKGSFREDLFYRLSVIPIVIPPLRHRKEDIPLLAEHFLKKFAAANNSKVRGFTKSAMQKLMDMKWEGNVRELENLIERTVVLAQKDVIDLQDIPTTDMMDADQFINKAISDFPTLEQLEKRYIQYILEKTNGKKEACAQILGINRRTLYRKEREYGFVEASDSEISESHFDDLKGESIHQQN